MNATDNQGIWIALASLFLVPLLSILLLTSKLRRDIRQLQKRTWKLERSFSLAKTGDNQTDAIHVHDKNPETKENCDQTREETRESGGAKYVHPK